MARFDNDTLAILLPEMTEAEAQSFMDELDKKIRSVPIDVGNNHKELSLRSTISAVAHQGYRTKQEIIMDQVAQAMEDAADTTT